MRRRWRRPPPGRTGRARRPRSCRAPRSPSAGPAGATGALGRPLAFVVTPKTRTGEHRPAWRTIWPQLTAMVLLVVSAVVGTVRLVAFDADLGATLVSLAWVAYDLAVLGVLVPGAR